MQLRLKKLTVYSLAVARFIQMSVSGTWAEDEDFKLVDSVFKNSNEGQRSWKAISDHVGTRSIVQWKNRWSNTFKQYLDEDKWTKKEDDIVKDWIRQYGQSEIHRFSGVLKDKNSKQAMIRWFSWIKPNLLKSFDTESWTKKQDELLSETILKFGWLNWNKVASFVGDKTTQECEERWNEMVNVGLEHKQKVGSFSKDEDKLLFELVNNQTKISWRAVAKMLPGRNIIQWKNRWSQTSKHKMKAELSTK